MCFSTCKDSGFNYFFEFFLVYCRIFLLLLRRKYNLYNRINRNLQKKKIKNEYFVGYDLNCFRTTENSSFRFNIVMYVSHVATNYARWLSYAYRRRRRRRRTGPINAAHRFDVTKPSPVTVFRHNDRFFRRIPRTATNVI